MFETYICGIIRMKNWHWREVRLCVQCNTKSVVKCLGYIENGRRNMSRVYVDGNSGRMIRDCLREGYE